MNAPREDLSGIGGFLALTFAGLMAGGILAFSIYLLQEGARFIGLPAWAWCVWAFALGAAFVIGGFGGPRRLKIPLANLMLTLVVLMFSGITSAMDSPSMPAGGLDLARVFTDLYKVSAWAVVVAMPLVGLLVVMLLRRDDNRAFRAFKVEGDAG